MLSVILGLIQDFERRHGRRPQLVYLNDRHLAALQHECPVLLEAERSGRLGFVICRSSEYETPHPRVAWAPNVALTSEPLKTTRKRNADILPFLPVQVRKAS